MYNPLKLSDEELEQIEQLAGAGYSPERIAMYLGVAKKDFMAEWFKVDSAVDYHYKRGVLLVEAESGIKLGENAKAGNITAFQELRKLQESITIENIKKRTIYGEEEID